ncbi:MAG: hypothetical protein WDO73_34635 [Ignavibacteriota bacterium]
MDTEFRPPCGADCSQSRPAGETAIHHHGKQDTIVYVLAGKALVQWGTPRRILRDCAAWGFRLRACVPPAQEINLSPDCGIQVGGGSQHSGAHRCKPARRLLARRAIERESSLGIDMSDNSQLRIFEDSTKALTRRRLIQGVIGGSVAVSS